MKDNQSSRRELRRQIGARITLLREELKQLEPLYDFYTERPVNEAADPAQSKRASYRRRRQNGRKPIDKTIEEVMAYVREHGSATPNELQQAGIAARTTVLTHISEGGRLEGKVTIQSGKGINTRFSAKPITLRGEDVENV